MLKNFLSSFAGTLMAVALLVAIAVGYGACAAAGKKPKIKDGSWLVVEIYGGLLEYDPPGDIMSQLTVGDTETLQRILTNMRKAAVDDRIEGVIFRVSYGTSIGAAKAEEVREAIQRLREAGKKVYGYAEALDARELYMLAACDEIFSPPSAFINFHGFAAGSVHVKKALDKLGIKPNMHKIKDYKSAAELVMREDMSAPARENTEWMMDEFWDIFVDTLAEDRGLDAAKIEDLMQHAMFTADEALGGGLIDRLLYWDEVETMLKGEKDDELRTVSQARYAEVRPAKLGLRGKKKISVIHAQGTITGRKNSVNPLLGITMGHESIVAELRRARENDRVAAIVLRVDSPGGVALDSDLMGHEVELTTQVKPVVVSMVDVAASGGYHISYRANKIVADAMTVTGSIGSITGKFNMREFYDKLGITHDFVTKGPNALIYSGVRDFTPAERARFEDNHWDGFNEWLQDVSEHRGMSFEEAEKLAHGRVWTGRQAAANGLVDEIGDLEHAIALAKQLAEIPDDEGVSVAHFPKKKSLIQSLLGGEGAATTAARWVAYRFIRDDLAGTWDLVTRHPEVAAQSMTP